MPPKKKTPLDDIMEDVVAQLDAPVPVIVDVPPVSAPPVADHLPVVIPADAGVGLYRDRAEPPRASQLMEGVVNFATVTEAARAVVKE
jgi:hypothetical protein